MAYTRVLKYRLPMLRGNDVLELQLALRALGLYQSGQPDGLFGMRSDAAVRAFQTQNGLTVDGVFGPQSWTRLAEALAGAAPAGTAAPAVVRASAARPADRLAGVLADLTAVHGYRDSVRWHLTPIGLAIGDEPPQGSGGEPKTMRRVWGDFGPSIVRWATQFGVPAELILATIGTESGGDPRAVREEPGYRDDERTPGKVSVGLMQTLISTAREALGEGGNVDRAWLEVPDNAIKAGTACIASKFPQTQFDPPKVACAYNAGGVYYQDGAGNRWKMRQYPIGSAAHADRFVQWFNDVFLLFAADGGAPDASFWARLNART
ncbi:transglycosylase-like protein with SLT domain [Plasticicumulans lactativorans]|uniref:Transglycosylase-like protein with SLT domain n=1 Tax=Plasticicumulans lactativorans TaxID=1133106 RepID=A0A4R2KX01_9GAMM|nr:peptidoglycan-binding protein [Plasticicumulans lactativorans]TCO75786.1 transglycosylase-like protein with SLT domain [Plasticicumulans lactativorans]